MPKAKKTSEIDTKSKEKTAIKKKEGLFASKTVGFKEIFKKGLGGTVGGPIFVILGIAIYQARSGLLISLALNGILMIFFVMIFSELALSLPIAGGGYSFSKEAIGGGYGFFIGWLMWIGNLLFAALSGLGFALSISVFLPTRFLTDWVVHIIGALAVILMFVYNLKFPKSLTRFMQIMTYILLVGFVVFIVVGLALGPVLNSNNYSSDILSEPFDFNAVFAMTGFTFVIFCVYEWNSSFESLTATFDKIKKPRENIPKGFIYSIFIAILLYWLVGLVTLLNIGDSESESWNLITSSGAPLADTFGLILGSFGIYFMAFIGMVATITSINAGIQMSTHLMHSMARDGFMHPIVKKKKNGVQIVALIISSTLIIILTLASNLEFITEISNFIFLVSMAFLSLSVLILRKTRPKLSRPWKIPGYPVVPIISFVMSILLAIFIIYSPEGTNSFTAGIAVSLLGVIYYLFQISRRDRLMHFMYGCKAGVSGFIVFFVFMLKIDYMIGSSSIRWFFIISIIIGIGSLLFDLIPFRSIVFKFMKRKEDSVVVGGIRPLPENKETLASKLTLIYGSILIVLGLIFGVFLILGYFNILTATAPLIIITENSLRIIILIFFGFVSFIFLVNGVAVIFQEIEIRKINQPTDLDKKREKKIIKEE
jgi:basic amino acid/polyamine antiporter, APA family